MIRVPTTRLDLIRILARRQSCRCCYSTSNEPPTWRATKRKRRFPTLNLALKNSDPITNVIKTIIGKKDTPNEPKKTLSGIYDRSLEFKPVKPPRQRSKKRIMPKKKTPDGEMRDLISYIKGEKRMQTDESSEYYEREHFEREEDDSPKSYFKDELPNNEFLVKEDGNIETMVDYQRFISKCIYYEIGLDGHIGSNAKIENEEEGRFSTNVVIDGQIKKALGFNGRPFESTNQAFFLVTDGEFRCCKIESYDFGDDVLEVKATLFPWEESSAFKEMVQNYQGSKFRIVPCPNSLNVAIFRLRDLPYSKFQNLFLSKPLAIKEASDEAPKEKPLLVDPVFKNLNDSQQRFIKSALSNPLTVLRGPPGTGKTETIFQFIINYLERARSNELFERYELPNVAVKENGVKKKDLKPRVLVVAGSNVAVDNILAKLIKLNKIAPLRILSSAQKDGYDRESEFGPYCLHNIVLSQYIEENPDQLGVGFSGVQDPEKFADNLMGDSSNWKLAKKSLEVVLNAEVILTTTYISASALLKKVNIDCIIMDESSQVSEIDSILPLAREEIKKVVLVGDENQLQPFAGNSDATKSSLFDQIIQSEETFGQWIQMLDTQYRMHPAISAFSIEKIYENKLKDGVDANDRILDNGPGPLVFVDYWSKYQVIPELKEMKNGKSFLNRGEAKLIVEIIKKLMYSTSLKLNEIGIVTPYAAQKDHIAHVLGKDRLINPRGDRALGDFASSEGFVRKRKETMKVVNGIMIGSIDVFQGHEKPVIIFSTVRSNDDGETGFLKSKRRLNVGITRAQYSLIMVGNYKCLQDSDPFLDDMLRHFETRGRIIETDEFLKEKWTNDGGDTTASSAATGIS